MARTSRGPWWWAARRQWYVTHKGRQISLGADEAEAHRRWHFLEAAAQTQTAGDGNPFVTLADEFLDWIQRHKKIKTYKVYRIHLEAMGKVNPSVTVAELQPHHVEAVVQLHTDWGRSTVRGFMVCINTCLNWAVKQGYTSKNPLHRRLSIPPIVSRGGEHDVPVPQEDYAVMLQHANPQLRDFLVACRNTGTRPENVAAVTAADYHRDAACWVLKIHKTDDDGQPLVIHLNPTMVALTERLIQLHPEGPLFRNNRGNPWRDETWGKAMAYLRATLKRKNITLQSRGIMYGFRHAVATELLEAGVQDTHVAAIMGHKSTAMLHKHYSHLTTRHTTLKTHLGHIQPMPGESTTGDASSPPVE